MSDNSAIEWCDATWNPVTGCDEVSPGCDHCYAKTFAERWRGTPGHYFQNGFDVQLRPSKLSLPLSWRKPRKVFVNSMSDLFHDAVPDEYIARVFAVMAATPQHTYQLLTKRHGRMRSFLRDDCKCGSGHAPGVHLKSAMDWASTPHSPTYVAGIKPGLYHRITWPLPNVWIGVSVENQQWADIRIPALLDTPAAVRWLSCEPLLGPIDLDLSEADYLGGRRHVDWVVVGGESGPGARPMNPDWARSLRDQCTTAGVPFHFKQRGEWTWSPHGEQAAGFVGPQGEWSRDLPRASRLDRWHAVWRVGKGRAGRVLDGRTWDEFPVPVVVGGEGNTHA